MFKVGDTVKVNKGNHKDFKGAIREIDPYETLSESFWETGIRSYDQHQMVNLVGLEHIWFGEGMIDKV